MGRNKPWLLLLFFFWSDSPECIHLGLCLNMRDLCWFWSHQRFGFAVGSDIMKKKFILTTIKYGKVSLSQKWRGITGLLYDEIKLLVPNWVIVVTLTPKIFIVGLLSCAWVRRAQVDFWMEHQSTSSVLFSCSSCGCRSWHTDCWPVTSHWQVRWPWPCRGSV